MTGRRPAIVALVAALGLAMLAPLAGPLGLPGSPPTPEARAAAAVDVTLVTDAVYTVHPGDGRVAVAVTIVARNRTKETRTHRYWADRAFLAVQPGATNLRLAGQKGAAVRVRSRTGRATVLRLDFGSRLYSGRSATFRLTFDLPGRGADASPDVRVGASLVTLPLWAFATEGASGSTVTVRLPGAWDVAVETGELGRRTVGGSSPETVLESGRIDQPLAWFAFVTAQRPAVLVDRVVAVPAGDREAALVLRAWEDDPGWADRVEAVLGRVLPVLREAVGLPWPLADPLVVAESLGGDAGDAAGRFDAAARRMEIAWWADDGVIVQQAAHAWFNDALLADRWANEGFATYYALRAAGSLGLPKTPPTMTDDAEAAALPLADWPGATGDGGARDAYAQAAAHRVAAEVAEAVGPRVLERVWADAAAGVGAYQPPVPPASAAGSMPDPGAGGGPVAAAATSAAPVEPASGPPDWRALLDLLEDRSGSDLAATWRTWVVAPADLDRLQARADARQAYRRTLVLADDWALPRAIRDAMRAWDFETATARMADARTVVAQRNALAELAEREAVDLPDDMRARFEAGDLAGASARAEAERNAILAIGRAEAARSTDDDLLRRIGMLGEHPEADVAAAREAVAAGDVDRALRAADRAHRAWTVAWEEGRRRVMLAVAGLATLLVLAAAGLASARRSRRSPARAPGSPAAPPPAGDDPTA